MSFEVGGEAAVIVLRRPPWVVRGPDEAGMCPVQNEAGDPVGIRRPEDDRHRASVGDAHHDGALGAGSVENGPDVVRSLIEGRDALHPVGQARSALVEDDQAAERRETVEVPSQERLLPTELDV
jgi:hypothetical protein